jgi:hypothetical protein
MRVRSSPSSLLRHLLLLSLAFHCVASTNQQSASFIEDKTTDNAAVARPLDRKASRDVRARVNRHLSLSVEEEGSFPARSLQGASNGTSKECKGSKFQIVIHFDAHPEDFAMRLKNDDTNKTIWAFTDHKYNASYFQHKTVAAGVCLPRDWCWVLTVSDSFGDGCVDSQLPRSAFRCFRYYILLRSFRLVL